MAMALGGCVPSTAEMVKEIKGYPLPADVVTGTGLIYVIDAAPSLVSPSKAIFLDGEDDAKKVGSLSSDEYIYFYVSPGYHSISTPQWSPFEMVVDVEEGDILFILLKSGKEQKNHLKQIDGVRGRYYVKHSKPGDFWHPGTAREAISIKTGH
jgi:hypothetical protein